MTKVTADYDRWALLKSNEPLIIQLQARLRGNQCRKAFSSRLDYLKAHEQQAVTLQVSATCAYNFQCYMCIECSAIHVPVHRSHTPFGVTVHVVERSVWSIECRGFESHPGSSFFLGKVTALGVLCCFALFVCLTLLASFFLPSHLSFKNMYMHVYRALTPFVVTCIHVHTLYIYMFMCIVDLFLYIHCVRALYRLTGRAPGRRRHTRRDWNTSRARLSSQ